MPRERRREYAAFPGITRVGPEPACAGLSHVLRTRSGGRGPRPADPSAVETILANGVHRPSDFSLTRAGRLMA